MVEPNCSVTGGEGGRVPYVALLSSAAQSETVITVNQGLRGGKIIELKKTVDQAVKQCPRVKRVLVSMRTTNTVPMTALDVPLEEVRGCPATSAQSACSE